jgi:hypothetical protein
MASSTQVAGPLSVGEHQKATQAWRSLLVRITTLTLALTGLMGLAAFPRAAQVSAHAMTSQQTSAVTMQTSTEMRQYVFARSTDDHLVVRWAVDGTPGQTAWSPWQDLGLSSMDSAPSVTNAPGNSIIDGVYRQGNSIQHFTYDIHTGQVTREPLGRVCDHSFGGFCFVGGFDTAPTIVDEGSGRLEVFTVLESQHTMIHKVRTVQQDPPFLPLVIWSNWSTLSVANFVGDPTALVTPGRTDVFIRSTDNHIYDKTFQNGHWTLWQDLGGLFTSGPAAMSPGDGTIKVVARNLQGGTDVTTFSNGQWIFWTPLDPTAVGQDGVVPAVTASGVPGYAYDLFFELPGGFLDVHSVTASGNAILDHELLSGGIHINSTPAAVMVSY